MKLTDVKGVGESAAKKLQQAGVETVDELAEIDQRSTPVEGLSQSNVARLRDNARALLDAVDSGDLTLVDGLGPSAARKLSAVGIETIQDLLELDLRSADVEGLSTENLQKLKRNAAYLAPSD